MRIFKNREALVAVFFVFLFIGANMADAGPPAKSLTLKVSTWTASPQANIFTRAFIWILPEVERRTGGQVKFEYYHSGSLVPAKETIAGLKSGIADIAFVSTSYEPGKIPLSTVTTLPAIAHDAYSSCMAFADLLKMPELRAEFDQNNMMYLGPLCAISYGFWTKQPVRSIADLKGKKIMAVGEHTLLMKAFGAVPVSIVSTEAYPALEKGIVDGGLANPGYANDYKWQEVCPYYYELLLGSKPQLLAINKNSWQKLPPDVQKMFIDLNEEACRKGHEIYQGNAEAKLKEFTSKGIVTATKPSPADVALLQETSSSLIWVKWVKKMEERGLPGQKVLDSWRSFYAKYDELNPFKK